MNAFNEAIARAKEKGWAEGAKRMEMEKRMASALVKACLARGYAITIDNGEEVAIARSTSYRKVMDALWQCDEETVIILQPDGTKVGWFWLVFGNDGWDLIADFWTNPITDEIYDTVISPLSDKLCMEAVG